MKNIEKIFFSNALNLGIEHCLENDENVFFMGEDISTKGGAFGVTKGLFEKFGNKRILDMPISENSFVGMAIGAAMNGLRPVVEIMYMDFIALAMDQILNKISKLPYISNGFFKLPITIRTTAGGGRFYGPDHSQSLEPLFMNIPNITIVVPSNVNDAYHLIKESINYDGPILFIEYRKLYELRGNIDFKDKIEFGKAKIVEKGNDLTILSYGRMLNLCQSIIKKIKDEKNIGIELIDLRFLKPLDYNTIIESVKKTGRIITVEESCKTSGIGSEVIAYITENIFYDLDAPPFRIAAKDMPIPFSPYIENKVLPDEEKIYLEICEYIKDI
ncbi:MAG TPA: transketolase C-terminal domain-containing protein [bacterium]|nr:transketolase C-terminal domain-containing protein [bacterium]